jgi:rhodanese-related sulfurtransferase
MALIKGGKEMKKVLTVLVALAVLLVAGQVMAAKVPTPESFDGITVVGAEWVKANMSKVTIYDARKKGEYVEKHIPGAISATYGEKSAKNLEFDSSKDKFKLKKYPTDKSAPIVVYCNGPKCWKSFKSAILLVREGYTNVNWLRDGFPGWLDKGYATE